MKTMTIEENKAVVRSFFEAASTGNTDALDNLMIADIVNHGDALFPYARGIEAVKNGIQAFRAAFPDLTITVEELFAEADRVAAHISLRGTHRGEWLGAAPTGKTVTWTASCISRFADGKIAERWAIEDELSLMRQLGVASTNG
jgi:steroid delta-isomerase-like uncharacterized protein